MKSVHFCASMLLLCAGGVLTRPQPAAAGTQTMIARYTSRLVVIDGALGPAEWSAAVPVTVGDDDCGCSTFDNPYPYPNGYIAWDGSSANWYVWDETAWGTLYLAP